MHRPNRIDIFHQHWIQNFSMTSLISKKVSHPWRPKLSDLNKLAIISSAWGLVCELIAVFGIITVCVNLVSLYLSRPELQILRNKIHFYSYITPGIRYVGHYVQTYFTNTNMQNNPTTIYRKYYVCRLVSYLQSLKYCLSSG